MSAPLDYSGLNAILSNPDNLGKDGNAGDIHWTKNMDFFLRAGATRLLIKHCPNETTARIVGHSLLNSGVVAGGATVRASGGTEMKAVSLTKDGALPPSPFFIAFELGAESDDEKDNPTVLEALLSSNPSTMKMGLHAVGIRLSLDVACKFPAAVINLTKAEEPAKGYEPSASVITLRPQKSYF